MAEELDWRHVTGGFFDLYVQLHALVLKGASQLELAPAFHSTPGDRWGYEMRWLIIQNQRLRVRAGA
jgi:hypothetical protein